MIQLPSKIRTTLFGVAGSSNPLQLFTYEDDRRFVVISVGVAANAYPIVGRSKQDVLNSDGIGHIIYTPFIVYGVEPIWFASGYRGNLSDDGFFIVQGVYQA